MAYSINEHKHRFSAWAASRAASVKGCRFSVEAGKSFLEETNISQFIDGPETLPIEFDLAHRQWRHTIIESAFSQHNLAMTHGVAAKLINVYLKALFVCGGHHLNKRTLLIHPPIDALLLEALTGSNVGGLKSKWKRFKKFVGQNFQVRNTKNLCSS